MGFSKRSRNIYFVMKKIELKNLDQLQIEKDKLPTVSFEIPTSPHHKPFL